MAVAFGAAAIARTGSDTVAMASLLTGSGVDLSFFHEIRSLVGVSSRVAI
jgi:hypothetical protein